MPIVDQQLIQVYGNEDLSISFLEELGRRKCIDIQAYATTIDAKEQLHDIVKKLVGEKVIECDSETCCISENYDSFVEKLRRLES